LVWNYDDVIWDCLEGEDLGDMKAILDTQLGGSKNSCRSFVVEKPHILLLIDHTFYLVVFLFHFDKTCNFDVILMEF
jgi:hypothetical protein